ncbi:MAG: iron-sulfur cluster assembly accessory protein [Pseudomonadota bacterium]
MAISVTASAAEHIKGYLERDPGQGLRLGVKKTGCSGWAYEVSVARQAEEDDVVFEDLGVAVIVAREILTMVEGTIIDFVTSGLNSHFVFRNPNVEDECGCGESFAVSPDALPAAS